MVLISTLADIDQTGGTITSTNLELTASTGVDVAQVVGTGKDGRVTKEDLVKFIEQSKVKLQSGIIRKTK